MQTELFLTTISAAFLHGITSSIHCLGMCGPFAGTLNLYQKEARFKTNLFYNLGRFLSYSTLGAILGFAGSGLNLAGNIVSLREFAAVISGIFVIVFGLRLLQNAGPERSGVYQKILNKFAAPLIISLKQGKNLSGIPLVFGMVTGLLPCSALYPAFSLAFATGDVGYGSVIMSAFFLGTFPALFFWNRIPKTRFKTSHKRNQIRRSCGGLHRNFYDLFPDESYAYGTQIFSRLKQNRTAPLSKRRTFSSSLTKILSKHSSFLERFRL